MKKKKKKFLYCINKTFFNIFDFLLLLIMNRNYYVVDDDPGTGVARDAASETSSMDVDGETGRGVTTGKSLIPKPPMFSGKRVELNYFLGRIEKYFKYNLKEDAEDEEKIDILSCYLDGKAAEWYSNLQQEESPLLESYEDFITAMKERYKTCASTDVANAQLTKMKYTQYHSVAEFCDAFEKTAKDSSFNDEAKIYFFTTSLPVKIQDRIKLIHPRIRKLDELINVVAANLELDRRIYGPDPMDVDGRKVRPLNRGLGNSNYRSLYQIPSNYKDESKNFSTTKTRKCFVCNRVGHIKKECPVYKDKLRNRPKVCTIMADRRRMLNMFKVILEINGGLILHALVDSGSDLEFIDWKTVKQFNIPVQKLFKDKYIEGLGGNGQINFQTIPMTMIINNHAETIQFYVTDLPSKVSLILGNHWLHKHDPILSFKGQTIEFTSEYCKKVCCATPEEIRIRLQEEEKEKQRINEEKHKLANEIKNNYKNKIEDSSDNKQECKDSLVSDRNDNSKKDKISIRINKNNKTSCIKKKSCSKKMKSNKNFTEKYIVCCCKGLYQDRL